MAHLHLVKVDYGFLFLHLVQVDFTSSFFAFGKGKLRLILLCIW